MFCNGVESLHRSSGHSWKTKIIPRQSKHLKGRLDPRVGDSDVFCIKGGQLDLPVGDGHFFCIKGGQLDPPVSDGHVFCIKGGRLDPPVGGVTFLHQNVPDRTESWPGDPNLGLAGRRLALA